MEKYYTINDIAEMTGLSDRTLRNYIKSGTLQGEKIDGIWQFTAEEYCSFISDKNVIPSLRARKNALIYDFILDEKKRNEEICGIIDIPAESREAMEISDFFCREVNETTGTVKMYFTHRGNHARVMLSGDAQVVAKIIGKFYEK